MRYNLENGVAVRKGTAHKLAVFGKDIIYLNSVVVILKPKVKKVFIKVVTSDNNEKVDKHLP